MDPTTVSLLGGIAFLIIERVFSRVRKSKCFKCVEVDFEQSSPQMPRETTLLRGGVLRSVPDSSDRIYEDTLAKK